MKCLILKICNFLSHIKQIWVIFNHLSLWVAVARHNIKWVKIKKNSTRLGLELVDGESALNQRCLNVSCLLVFQWCFCDRKFTAIFKWEIIWLSYAIHLTKRELALRQQSHKPKTDELMNLLMDITLQNWFLMISQTLTKSSQLKCQERWVDIWMWTRDICVCQEICHWRTMWDDPWIIHEMIQDHLHGQF